MASPDFMTISETAALTSAFTLIFGLAAIFLGEVLKWFFRRGKEKTLLKKTVRDLSRHLQRGLDRIEEFLPTVSSGNRKIAIVHIKKLRVDDKNLIFSDENLRYLNRRDISRVVATRFRIRNFNLDCDLAVQIYEQSDRETLSSAIEFVKERNSYLKQQNREGIPTDARGRSQRKRRPSIFRNRGKEMGRDSI